jgi:hypothetical protein
MKGLIAIGLLLAALGGPGCRHDCVDIACLPSLVLTVEGVTDLAGATGTFAVGTEYLVVDCSAESADYYCDGNVITLHVHDGVTEPVDVTWSLTVPAGDGTAAMEGEGTFRPDWEEGEYYDPDCLPTCWFGTGTVAVA